MQDTMLIPMLIVKLSTFAQLTMKVVCPSTPSSVPMAPSSTKHISFVIGGSMLTVMRPQLLQNPGMLKSLAKEKLQMQGTI